MKAILLHVLLMCILCFGCFMLGCSSPESTEAISLHPVFHTPMTGSTAARPAAQVDVMDASEAWFFTAELYLAVQSSRFPQDTWVLLPINRGDFEGCLKRFVQLPFEVTDGDTLVFNLLDDDELTHSQESLIVNACRTSGYCIVVAGSAYSGGSAHLIAPVAREVAGALGEAIVDDFELHRFENLGTADFTAVLPLPATPRDANKLTLLDNKNYARVQLKLYGPTTSLALHPALAPDAAVNNEYEALEQVGEVPE